MNNLFFKLTTFCLMFVLGLGVFISWKYFIAPIRVKVADDVNFESVPIKTTVCEIENYSNNFEGKLVSFKATTYNFDNELILFPLDCTMRGTNLFLNPTIRINNGFNGNNSNLLTILQSLQPRSKNPDYSQMKEVDVEVIGIVKEYYDEDGHKLFSIIPKKIKIISDFRQFEPKGAA